VSTHRDDQRGRSPSAPQPLKPALQLALRRFPDRPGPVATTSTQRCSARSRSGGRRTERLWRSIASPCSLPLRGYAAGDSKLGLPCAGHLPILSPCSSSPKPLPPRSAPQGGELSAAIELRRLFPGITDNAKARECPRTSRWRSSWSRAPRSPRRTASVARIVARPFPNRGISLLAFIVAAAQCRRRRSLACQASRARRGRE
jgi:hypothetical protein